MSILNKKGATLIEVIVGSIILVSALGGLLVSFTTVRIYINRSQMRMCAANLIRSVFNGLYKAVRGDEWNDSGNPVYGEASWYTHTLPNYTVDNINYQTNNYEVRNVTGKDYREIKVNINYPADDFFP